jgi:pilus assembly protein Flp/PilA
MTKLFARFLKDDSGATAIEYGLIAALISVALIAGATSLGGVLNSTFHSISDKMDTANTTSQAYN